MNTLRTSFNDANTTAKNFGITIPYSELSSLVSLGEKVYVSFQTEGNYLSVEAGATTSSSFLPDKLYVTSVSDYVSQVEFALNTSLDFTLKLTPMQSNTRLNADVLVSSVPFTNGTQFDVEDTLVEFGKPVTRTTVVSGMPLGVTVDTVFPKGVTVKINGSTISDGSSELNHGIRNDDVITLGFGISEPSEPDYDHVIQSGSITTSWKVIGRDRAIYAEERKLFSPHENEYRHFRFWNDPIPFRHCDLTKAVPFRRTENKDDLIPCLNMVVTKSQKETFVREFPIEWTGESCTLKIDSQGLVELDPTACSVLLRAGKDGAESTTLDVVKGQIIYVVFGYPQYPEIIDFMNDPYSFVIKNYRVFSLISYQHKQDGNIDESAWQSFLAINVANDTADLLRGNIDYGKFVDDVKPTEIIVYSKSLKEELVIKDLRVQSGDTLNDITFESNESFIGNAVLHKSTSTVFIPLYDASINKYYVKVWELAGEVHSFYINVSLGVCVAHIGTELITKNKDGLTTLVPVFNGKLRYDSSRLNGVASAVVSTMDAKDGVRYIFLPETGEALTYKFEDKFFAQDDFKVELIFGTPMDYPSNQTGEIKVSTPIMLDDPRFEKVYVDLRNGFLVDQQHIELRDGLWVVASNVHNLLLDTDYVLGIVTTRQFNTNEPLALSSPKAVNGLELEDSLYTFITSDSDGNQYFSPSIYMRPFTDYSLIEGNSFNLDGYTRYSEVYGLSAFGSLAITYPQTTTGLVSGITSSKFRKGSITYASFGENKTTPKLITERDIRRFAKELTVDINSGSKASYLPLALDGDSFASTTYVLGGELPLGNNLAFNINGSTTKYTLAASKADYDLDFSGGYAMEYVPFVTGNLNVIAYAPFGYASISKVRHPQSNELDHTIPNEVPFFENSNYDILDIGTIDLSDAKSLAFDKMIIGGTDFKFIDADGSNKTFTAWSQTAEAQSQFSFDNNDFATLKSPTSYITKEALSKFGNVTVRIFYPTSERSISFRVMNGSTQLQSIVARYVNTAREAVYIPKPHHAIEFRESDVTDIDFGKPINADLRTQFPFNDRSFPLNRTVPFYKSDDNYTDLSESSFVIDSYSTSVATEQPNSVQTYQLKTTNSSKLYLKWLFEDTPVSDVVMFYSNADWKEIQFSLDGNAVTDLQQGKTYLIESHIMSRYYLGLVISNRGNKSVVPFAYLDIYRSTNVCLSDYSPSNLTTNDTTQLKNKAQVSYYENRDITLEDLNVDYVPHLMMSYPNYGNSIPDDRFNFSFEYGKTAYFRSTDLKNINPASLKELHGISSISLGGQTPAVNDPIRRKTFFGAVVSYVDKRRDYVVATEDWSRYENLVTGNILSVDPRPVLSLSSTPAVSMNSIPCLVITDKGIGYANTGKELLQLNKKDVLPEDLAILHDARGSNYKINIYPSVVPRPEGYKFIVQFSFTDTATSGIDYDLSSMTVIDGLKVPNTETRITNLRPYVNFENSAASSSFEVTVPPFCTTIKLTLKTQARDSRAKFKWYLDPTVDITNWDKVWYDFDTSVIQNVKRGESKAYNTSSNFEVRLECEDATISLDCPRLFNLRRKNTLDSALLERSKGKVDSRLYEYNGDYTYPTIDSKCPDFKPYHDYVIGNSNEIPEDYVSMSVSRTPWLVREGKTVGGNQTINVFTFEEYTWYYEKQTNGLSIPLVNAVFIGASQCYYSGEDLLAFDRGESDLVEGMRTISIMSLGVEVDREYYAFAALNKLRVFSETPIDYFQESISVSYYNSCYTLCSLYPEVNGSAWATQKKRFPKAYQEFPKDILVADEAKDSETVYQLNLKRLPNYNYIDGLIEPSKTRRGLKNLSSFTTEVYSPVYFKPSNSSYSLTIPTIFDDSGNKIQFPVGSVPLTYRYKPLYNNVDGDLEYDSNFGHEVETLNLNFQNLETVEKLTKSAVCIFTPTESIYGNSLAIPIQLNRLEMNPEVDFVWVGDAKPDTWVKSNTVTMEAVSDGVVIESMFPAGTRVYLNGLLYVNPQHTDEEGVVTSDPMILDLDNSYTVNVELKSYHVYGGSVREDFQFNDTIGRYQVTNVSLNAEYNDKPDYSIFMYDWRTLDFGFIFDLPKKVMQLLNIKEYYLPAKPSVLLNTKEDLLVSLATNLYRRNIKRLIPKVRAETQEIKSYSSDTVISRTNEFPSLVVPAVSKAETAPSNDRQVQKELKAESAPANDRQVQKDIRAVFAPSNDRQVQKDNRAVFAPTNDRQVQKDTRAVFAPSNDRQSDRQVPATSEAKSSVIIRRNIRMEKTNTVLHAVPRKIPTYTYESKLVVRKPIQSIWHQTTKTSYPRYVLSYFNKQPVINRKVNEWVSFDNLNWLADSGLAKLIGGIWTASKLRDFPPTYEAQMFSEAILWKSPYESNSAINHYYFDRWQFLVDVKISKLISLYNWTTPVFPDRTFWKTSFNYSPKSYASFMNTFTNFLPVTLTVNKVQAEKFKHSLTVFRSLEGHVFDKVFYSCDMATSEVNRIENLLIDSAVARNPDREYRLIDVSKAAHVDFPTLTPNINEMESVSVSVSDIAQEKRVPGYFDTEALALADAERLGYVNDPEADYILVTYEYTQDCWAWSVRFKRENFTPDAIVHGVIRGG